jgi:hypothetical protein
MLRNIKGSMLKMKRMEKLLTVYKVFSGKFLWKKCPGSDLILGDWDVLEELKLDFSAEKVSRRSSQIKTKISQMNISQKRIRKIYTGRIAGMGIKICEYQFCNPRKSARNKYGGIKNTN